jgi:hypothetical protein
MNNSLLCPIDQLGSHIDSYIISKLIKAEAFQNGYLAGPGAHMSDFKLEVTI